MEYLLWQTNTKRFHEDFVKDTVLLQRFPAHFVAITFKLKLKFCQKANSSRKQKTLD